jgi:hypothetical protein
MLDLIARLESLLRRYAATYEQPDERERFRRDLNLLIGEYGYHAVDAALDQVPDGPCPSVALH